MSLDSLRERLAAVPDRPGVYLLRDARGQVIYVGKAAGLRARLRFALGATPSRAVGD